MLLLRSDLVRSCEKKEVSHVTVTVLFVKPFAPNISFFLNSPYCLPFICYDQLVIPNCYYYLFSSLACLKLY